MHNFSAFVHVIQPTQLLDVQAESKINCCFQNDLKTDKRRLVASFEGRNLTIRLGIFQPIDLIIALKISGWRAEMVTFLSGGANAVEGAKLCLRIL